MNYKKVIQFWFDELTPKEWFARNEFVDRKILQQFSEVHEQALKCELWSWRKEPLGRLAEIIVLDQFSRNLYREDAIAFAGDALALLLAQEAVSLGLDKQFSTEQKIFLYMPYMHSESKLVHEEAVKLFNQKGLEFNYDYELKHKAIIDRFGYYPHRNAVRGIESTPEEIVFLKTENSSF